MGSKVLYQTHVHKLKKKVMSLPIKEGVKTTPVDPVRKQYSRAVKQVVDTVAPGFNPRRTRNRSDAGRGQK